MARRRPAQHSAAFLVLLGCLALGATGQTVRKYSTLQLHGERSRRLLHTDGHADDSISISYKLESGRKSSDYKITYLSSAPGVIDKTDVDVLPSIEGSNRIVNSTLTCDFQRAVGLANIRISIVRSDGSEYQAITIRYIIVGISFYQTSLESNKNKLVSGNKLEVGSYKDLIRLSQLYVLYVVVCFPDGTVSSTSVSSKGDSSQLQKVLKGMKIGSSATPLFSSHSFDTCSTNHATMRADRTIALQRGCSFGFASEPDVYFGLRFLPHRAGSVKLNFVSEALVAGSDFEEAYETSLTVVVGGNPPPACLSIQPSVPFRQSGGDIMKVVVTNTQPLSRLYFILNGKHLSGFGKEEYISSSKTTVASFVTPAGQGRNIPFEVVVATGNEKKETVWAGDDPPYKFNYAASGPSVGDIEPKFGPARGGNVVRVTGNFPGFHASTGSGNNIHVGSHIVPKEDIVSVAETLIVFKMPPKGIASAHAFDVPILVEIGGQQTNSVVFEYESLSSVEIDVIGSSYDLSSKVHTICPSDNIKDDGKIIFVPVVNHGAHKANVTFSWVLVEESTRKSLQSGTSPWLVIPRTALSPGIMYNAVVLAREHKLGTQVESVVQITASTGYFYGLSLVSTRHRTISSPLSDLRVTATPFSTSGCQPRNASNRIAYEWSFAGSSYSFSYESNSIAVGATGGRRFGRELIIPRKNLAYGTHLVTCKAINMDNPSLVGTAALNISVSPSPLRAQIGSGQSYIQVPRGSSFTVRADGSADPDTASLDPSMSSKDLQYRWRCELSTAGGALFRSSAPCPSGLFPTSSASKKEVTISKETLAKVQSSGTESLYLRIFLSVRKSVRQQGSSISPEEVQIIEVSASAAATLDRTSLDSFRVQSGSGAPVDRDNFEISDSLVLTPTGPKELEWNFRLLEPKSESFAFLDNPKNLLSFPGYVEPNALISGRRSLGVRGGTLNPGTSYKFRVDFEPLSGQESGGFEEIVIKSQGRPNVSFPPLVQSVGTTRTVFVAAAESSVSNPDFKFYFYLHRGNGTKMCIDGCSGDNVALFRIPVPGSYNISCTMRQARGLGGEYTAGGMQTVTVLGDQATKKVTGADIQFSDIHLVLNETASSGDHGAFEIGSVSVADMAARASTKAAQNASTVLVAGALNRLCLLANTSEPNTPLGKDYVEIALAFSSIPIGSEAMADPSVFTKALCIVQKGVENTPSTESYDLEAPLIDFFENMAKHAQQHASGGSGRHRLVPAGSRNTELSTQVLDLNEVASPVVSKALSRNEPCGYRDAREISGVTALSIAVVCNIEQGAALKGKNSTLHWCPAVFTASGDSPVTFALSELPDYISDSNVLTYKKGALSMQEQQSALENGSSLVIRSGTGPDSTGIVKTYALKTSDPDTAFGSRTVVPAESGLESGRECFVLNQTVLPTTTTFVAANASNAVAGVSCSSLTAIQYNNVKVFGEPMPLKPYTEVPLPGGRQFTTFEAGSKATYVLAKLPTINDKTFAARRSSCQSATPLLQGVSAVAGITIGILVAVAASTLLMWLTMTWLITNRMAAPAAPVASGSPYVDRDIYGRDMIGRIRASELAPQQTQRIGDDEQVVFANLARGG